MCDQRQKRQGGQDCEAGGPCGPTRTTTRGAAFCVGGGATFTSGTGISINGGWIGGLIAGDVPTFRIDHMPYGGIKDSGLGREGLRDAIQEMTEPKLLVMNLR